MTGTKEWQQGEQEVDLALLFSSSHLYLGEAQKVGVCEPKIPNIKHNVLKSKKNQDYRGMWKNNDLPQVLIFIQTSH